MSARTVDPRARALNDRGVGFQREGSLAAAMEEYRQALEIAPEFVEAHNNLGTLLGAAGRCDEALSHFDRAISLDPQRADLHANRAIALYLMGRLEEAEAGYRAALAIAPRNADALGHLGEILIERGELAQGRAALEGAIALAPRSGWLYRRWAESGAVHPGDPRVRAMERLARSAPGLPPYDRMQLHFGLAKACDEAGDYAQAFRHARAANALKRRTIAYDEADALGSIERMKTQCSAEFVARCRGGARSELPVLIVGMPRSGSTLVEQLLAAHPAVYAAGELIELERALHETLAAAAFSGTFEAIDGGALERFGELYARRLAAMAPGALRVTDKMPLNFRYAGLVRLALPNARILHVVREPADAAISTYFPLYNGGMPFAYDLAELGRYYRAYRRLMRHWRELLGPEAILDVRYEDLVADLEGQARRIVAHCGLAWSPSVLEFHAAARPVRTASAVQVRRTIYASSLGRREHYARQLAPFVEALGE
ncbi:MAG TPA: sulfotransferase [Verrucomicrobiae bacterium]|nr:sulfotransferase [Verrucomicrobiae bacterium]